MDKVDAAYEVFLGREFPMAETEKELGGVTYGTVSPSPEADALIEELRSFAHKRGDSLRILWRGALVTADYRLDRVNVHIERGSEGVWRISRLSLG